MNPNKESPISIGELFASLIRNRGLVLQLIQREVIGRYRGSVMGVAWSFFNPILMLLVYTFVFSVIFKSRWGMVAESNQTSFAIVLFVGLIVHGVFAECVNRAPNLIMANINYVKKVVFPLEVLPWVAMGSALFHATISLLVLILAQLVLHHSMPWTIVFFPLIVLPLVLATTGLAWFIAALGVYVRDVGQMTGMLTTVLLFLSPIFYPVAALPEKFQKWIHLNPLTYIIEEARSVLIFGNLPDWGGWAVTMSASLAICWLGFAWFQKTRKGFADVL